MHQIRYFVAAADLLNFTRAAESCNVTQPALTRAIQKLEEELGGPLFRREGRRMHLTELGRKVHPRFEQALSLTKLAQEEALDFSRMVNAKLDLGCMCTIAPARVMSLIQFFNRKAPQLELCIHEASGRQLVDKLLAGELDVAIVALPVPSEELHAHALFEERYLITFPSSSANGTASSLSKRCPDGN
ncbi:MAG: LysR family transcriptional regulator, partial [Pseudomonadota bacterium]